MTIKAKDYMEGQVAFEFSLIGMSMMVMMTALILEREDHRAREGAKEERGRIIARREGGDELDHHTTTASDDALLAVGRAWDINLHSLSGSSCGHHCRDMALLDCTTIVTDAADMDDGEFDSAPPAEGTDGEDNDYRDHDDDDEILNCNDEDDDDRVPAEVKVSFWNLSDNDDSMTRRDRTGHEKGKCVAAGGGGGGSRPPSPRTVVRTYSSSLGGYIVGSMSGPSSTYRAKRARMYYP